MNCVSCQKSLLGPSMLGKVYLRTPYYVTETVLTGKTMVPRKVKIAKWRTLDDVVALMKGKPSESEVLLQSEEPSNEVESSSSQAGSGDSKGE